MWYQGIVCVVLYGTSWTLIVAAPPDASEKPQTSLRPPERIDIERARRLLLKERRGEKLTEAEAEYLKEAQAARRETAGRAQPQAKPPQAPGLVPRTSTGLKPLTEMTAEDRYQGQDGGLYGGGLNVPPPQHLRAAEAELSQIQPRDAAGQPSPAGRVVLISISMSNATQEFSRFKQLADASPVKSPHLTIVDCAQGGQAMAEWARSDAPPWQEADRRIAAAGVAPEQVQVAWIKLANKLPRGELADHGRRLQRDTQTVLQLAKARFPQLRVAYLSSRIYGGYATSPLNPEPYAYESGFVVRWLIQNQMQGAAALNYTASRGSVVAPLLLWGPYLWADGTTPRRADQLVYTRQDLASDGTHPSQSGRDKVARLLLSYFQTDALARSWFCRP
ncbi:MAG: hypothetical protein AB7F89_24670 [Pirellulaceae bacterium]